MRVLLVGSGGREHALAWKLAQSPKIDRLYWAPGNGGAWEGVEVVPLKADDVDGLVRFARENGVGLIVVGPEAPLVLGLVDRAAEAGIPAFGPMAAAARLEGSKSFTKAFCDRHGIPQAPYATFTEAGPAEEHLRSGRVTFPLVLKADGLAAGKGVLICQTLEEALEGTDRILRKREFGEAGSVMLVEGFLRGEEASLLVFCDGERAVPMPPARDFKRALDGDRGPNTGGMGAYCPATRMSDALIAEAMERIVMPTLRGMAAEGCPYRGVLYAGLMLTDEGPQLLEFNCRFGDPETQVVLPRLVSDLVEIMLACAGGTLDPAAVRWKADAAVTVVMASGGYPGAYPTGKVITGLEEAGKLPGVTVFHAGTRRDGGALLTSGGRVLNVTAVAPSQEEARRRAYEAVGKMGFENAQYRRDIAGER